MHYDIDYSNLSRDEADRNAIQDMQDWVSAKQWQAMLDYAVLINNNQASIKDFDVHIRIFIGIQGYPLEAFYRKYCLEAFKQWFAEEPAVPLDADGFRIDAFSATEAVA